LKSKIEGEIMRLRDKLTGLNKELSDLEEQIEAETNPKRIATLESKYNRKYDQFTKVDEQLAAKEEELRLLAA
jgi:uncharacterized coiled-coil protein SlyX